MFPAVEQGYEHVGAAAGIAVHDHDLIAEEVRNNCF